MTHATPFITLTVALIALGLVTLIAGCASAESDTDAPFMIKEAKLPEGFPPPGPVGRVIVKRYPAYRAAFIADDKGDMDGMFRPLFNHIKRNDIAMTAPVRMSYDADKASDSDAAPAPKSMAFYYRTTDLGNLGADAKDESVRVEDRPAVTVASVGVRGDYTNERFREAMTKLDVWLDEHADKYRRAGDPLYLGYNSPFVPGFLRYGEVQVPIEKIDADTDAAAPSDKSSREASPPAKDEP